MTKSIPDVKVNLKQIYKTYSDQIIYSNYISGLLIDHSNIKAAGSEIEDSLRKCLAKLLPEKVIVSQGHIIDESLKISYQQDVIIADNFFSKSLIQTLDGTEIFPYESVYATGEVKRQWSQKNLKSLIKSIERSKSDLTRLKIESNLIESGSSFIKTSNQITNNPFRNPLFTFSFSLDFDESYSLKRISQLLKNTKTEYLPNVSVVLNEGIFVFVNREKFDQGLLEVSLYPEFKAGEDFCWVFITMEPEDCLAYLVFMITQHLSESVLSKSAYLKYIQNMIEINLVDIKFI